MSSYRPEDRYFDGRGVEDRAGYARAVRRGDTIFVSGTTAIDDVGEVVHPGDAGGQTTVILERAIAAVEALGGRVDDVVRTRMFLVPGADWEAATRAHSTFFDAVRPANTTLFVHSLIGDGLMVEIEVEAVVGNPDDPGR